MNLEEKKLMQCKLMLDAIIGKDNAAKWWLSPNQAFDGLTPSAQWLVNHDIVYSYLLSHTFGGIYS